MSEKDLLAYTVLLNDVPYTLWLHASPELDVHNNDHYSPHKDASNTSADLDLTNVSFINEIWGVVNASQIIIKTSAFLPIVIWGIFGNFTLLYVILKNRHIRTPTNLLIANMAAADLASLLIHPWVFLIYDSFQNYQLGEIGCKLEGTVECSTLLASVMTLSVISYDRFTAIVLPKETRINRKGAKIVMAVTWCLGFALASPLYFYRTYKQRQWANFLEKYCTEDTIVINIYWHIIITMMVWVPLIVMLACYISIFIKLQDYEKMVQRSNHKFQVNYKKKVAKMMFIVVITFIICRTPFTALIFYRNQLLKNQTISKTSTVQNQVNGTYKTLWWISKYLIFMNAAINPLIYGLTNEKFRRVFKETSLSKWLFPPQKNRRLRTLPIKKKTTKETEIPSNKNKIFSIFKGKLKTIYEVEKQNSVVVM